MPKLDNPVSTIPDVLRPYTDHGVDLDYNPARSQAVADCPFCQRENKWSVEVETGVWRCFVCAAGNDKGGGNATIFVRLLWEMSCARTSLNALKPLAADRRLRPETLQAWGVCKGVLTGEWLIPGFGADGQLKQLYRYITMRDGTHRALPTTTLAHQLHGVNLIDGERLEVSVCEGPWDGMALWEALQETGDKSNVVAVPGAGVFSEAWLPLFKGRQVRLLYDNDYPRDNNGVLTSGAGFGGMKRVARTLRDTAANVSWLDWAGNGEGHTTDLPDGYDVRDALTAPLEPGDTKRSRLEALLGMLAPVPDEWTTALGSGSNPDCELRCVPCSDWKTLVTAWRKAMHWTEGLERGIGFMLACVISTPFVGSQLWGKLIGPASCGKTTLAEALTVNRKYVYAKDSLAGGLISGYQVDKEGSENLSTVEKLRDKTLIINDGDTLMQLPNLEKILSQLRAFYGRNIRSQYGNRMSSDHEGISCTVIICGTNSLRKLDASELGERFLDCVIMDSISDDLEDEVVWRVVNRVEATKSMEANGTAKSFHEPKLTTAFELTGGYINHLRDNAVSLLERVSLTDEAKYQCIKFGKFVAYMRARPSLKHDEGAEREFSARLVEQHLRLGLCLAAVLGKSKVDADVLEQVRKVCLDTARGRVLEIVRHVYEAGDAGIDQDNLILRTGQAHDKEVWLLRFLRRLGVLLYIKPEGVRVGLGAMSQARWHLSEKLRTLYEEVVVS